MYKSDNLAENNAVKVEKSMDYVSVITIMLLIIQTLE